MRGGPLEPKPQAAETDLEEFRTALQPVQTLGMDIGDRSSNDCLVAASGEVLSESRVATKLDSLATLFLSMDTCRVVLEACGHVHWIAKLASDAGLEVVVANPREVRLISQGGRKNDKNDARTLVRLGHVDVEPLRPVKLRGEECRASHSVLHGRDMLVRTRTKLVGFVRGQVKTFGGRIPTCSTAGFWKMAPEHVPDSISTVVTPILAVLEELGKEIRGFDIEIERLCEEEHPETSILRRIKGVGPVLVLAYVATIETPERFASSRTVENYVGLAPGQYAYGAKTPLLRISKRGDGFLRRLLVNASTYILGPFGEDSDLKHFGERLASSGSQRDKARARIAAATKPACVLHHLWRTGSVWDPNYAESVVTPAV